MNETDFKTAAIAATGSGNTAVIPASAGSHIRVYAYLVVGASAVNVKFTSNGTDLTGLIPISITPDYVAMPFNEGGWFMTTERGQGVNINLSGAVVTGGHITYGYEKA